MNLLLLLSALLSACTGVLAGGGQSVAPLAVSRGLGETRIAAVAAPARASLPVAAPVRLMVVALAPVAVTISVAAAQPIFASRRRV